MPSCSAVSV